MSYNYSVLKLFIGINFCFLFSEPIPFKGKWNQYRYTDGISSDYIFHIEKDKLNRLWLGTSNGITLIDGQEIFRYGINDGLPSTNITQIIEFKDKIYVGTSNQGVYVLENSKYKKLSLISGNIVHHMELIEGKLFISTDLENSIFDGKNRTFMGQGFPKISIKSYAKLKDKHYYANENGLIEGKDNRFSYKASNFSNKNVKINTLLNFKNELIVGTNKGLWKLDNKNNFILLNNKNDILTLAKTKKNELIVGAKSGVFYFDFSKSKLLSNNSIKLNVPVRYIYPVKNNEVWYATYGRGLYLNDPHTLINIDAKDGLQTGGMVNDLEYYKDITYIGTNNGLFLLKNNTIIQHLDKAKGLGSNKILDIDIDSKGNIWLATTNGLSSVKNNKIKNYFKTDGLPSNLVLSVHVDDENDNRIWSGSMKSGLTRYDDKGFYTFSVEDGLPSNWVQNINQHPNGSLILACYNAGVTFYDGKNFSLFNQGLSDKRVIATSLSNENTVWVATESGGVGKLIDKSFEMITDANGLGHNETYSVYSKNNMVFVGTFGGGVSCLLDDIWFTMNSFDGLIGNKISSVVFQNNQSYVIGGEDGISIFNLDNSAFDFGLKNISTPKTDITLKEAIDNSISGIVNDRFYMKANPKLYKPTSTNFKYRSRLNIKGEDNVDWSNLQTSTNIEVVPKKQGNYELEIQAIDNRLKFSNIVKIPFKINLVWYLNPKTAIPFWGGIVALIAFSIINFLNYQKKSKEANALREADRKRQQFELDEAREFQQALLPSKMPKTKTHEMIGFQKTATEVGGDYFDFTQKENGDWVAICGDATGHGLTSGNVVSITKTAMGALTEEGPVATLDSLNQTLLKMNIGLNRMCLNIANVQKDTIQFSSAGMPPAYFYSAEKKALEEVLVGALPLGSFKMAKHNLKEIPFKNKGDVFIMMSDGLPEAENPSDEMVGYERTLSTIESLINQSVEEIKDGLTKMCENWLDGADLKDDMTFVIIKRIA